MTALVIRGGHLIDPAAGVDALKDVLLKDGRVAEIAAPGKLKQANGAEVLDAAGLTVAPGLIDMHVHLREPGFEHAETIETGSAAAAAGGFTSICCMPNTAPVNDSATVTSYIVERARRHALVNVFPIGAITRGSKGEELASIGSMIAAGAVAVSDDGRPVMNSRVMRRAMEMACALGVPVIDHCEDLNLSDDGDMHECLDSVRLGLSGIPSASEDVMVARDILLAELTGARYHVAHISTTHAVEMVAFAKSRGLGVTAEATPHHIALHTGLMPPYDSNYKMKPPIRDSADTEAVVAGLVSGSIDAIATDHAPHAGDDKMQEFEKCPFGIIGLETALAVALETLFHSGRLSLPRLVELFSAAPARIVGLSGGAHVGEVLPPGADDAPAPGNAPASAPRGALAHGCAGDVTIFDPERRWTYDVNKSCSKSRNSPFHNREFRGGSVATVVAGRVVWRADGF
jgi:dihydroorotase